MKSDIPKPLLKIKGRIDHDQVQKLLSGENAVDSVNDDDAKILEQAIYEKFKDKKEQIVKGFKIAEKYDGLLGFNINFASGNSVFFHMRVKPRYEYLYGKKDSEPNEIISLYFRDGVSSGNAYGHAVEEITRTYKIKRLASAIPKIGAILDKFIEHIDKIRDDAIAEIAFEKKMEERDKRSNNQLEFEESHEHYKKLLMLSECYKVPVETNPLFEHIVRIGKRRLRQLKKRGKAHWIDEDREGFNYIEVFE